MLDIFLETAYEREERTDTRNQMAEAFKALPNEELAKIASGEVKMALYDDDDWLKKFQGTDMYDEALALEEQCLQLDIQDQQRRMADKEQNDSIWDAKDAIRLKKRMLELELRKQQLGDYSEEEPELEEAEAPAPPAEAEEPEAEEPEEEAEEEEEPEEAPEAKVGAAMDGTGPEGKGPGTGRGLGPCGDGKNSKKGKEKESCGAKTASVEDLMAMRMDALLKEAQLEHLKGKKAPLYQGKAKKGEPPVAMGGKEKGSGNCPKMASAEPPVAMQVADAWGREMAQMRKEAMVEEVEKLAYAHVPEMLKLGGTDVEMSVLEKLASGASFDDLTELEKLAFGAGLRAAGQAAWQGLKAVPGFLRGAGKNVSSAYKGGWLKGKGGLGSAWQATKEMAGAGGKQMMDWASKNRAAAGLLGAGALGGAALGGAAIS